jgi:Concanavalin A-like lectin/glucanases superfamily/PKD domain/Right handed beta helix region
LAESHCKAKENLMFSVYRFLAFKLVGTKRKKYLGRRLSGLYVLAGIFCTLFFTQPALSDSQKTIAHSGKELANILAAAQGGEIVYFDPAEDNVEVRLDGINSFKTPVTIRPLNPRTAFNISYLKLTKSSNLVFDGLPFSMHRQSAVATGPSNIDISGSQNITFSNCIMKGTAKGYLTEATLNDRSANLSLIRESDHITFAGNNISGYYQGLQFLETTRITVTGNEIYQVQADGMRMGGVADVVISGNYFHDFLGSDQEANHSDMLQLWSTNAVIKSNNILVSDNRFISGDGSATQSIFMRNELADQPTERKDQYYRNITIENNLIYNGHSHGITVGETNGLTIERNTLLHNPQSTIGNGTTRVSWAPTIHVSKHSTDVRIANNITKAVNAGPDAVIQGNLTVNEGSSSPQDSVNQLFVGAASGGELPPLALHVLPDSVADVPNLGSTLTKQEAGNWKESIFFRAQELGEKSGNMGFQVQQLPSAKASPEQDNASFAWDFGDGATATGPIVQHAFASLGRFKVTLRILGTNGSTGQYWNYVTVTEPLLFRMKNDGTEIVDASSYHSKINSKLQTSQLGPISGLPTLALDRDSHIEIGRGEPQLFNLQRFGISFFFKCDAHCQAGTIAMIHKSFELRMSDANEFQFHLVDSTGQIVDLRSGRTRVANEKWQHFVLNYDAPAGNAKLYIDGVLVSQAAATAATQVMQSWGLALGNMFSKSAQGILAGLEFSRFPYGPSQIAEQLKLLPQ